jgi:hypothetical protein
MTMIGRDVRGAVIEFVPETRFLESGSLQGGGEPGLVRKLNVGVGERSAASIA